MVQGGRQQGREPSGARGRRVGGAGLGPGPVLWRPASLPISSPFLLTRCPDKTCTPLSVHSGLWCNSKESKCVFDPQLSPWTLGLLAEQEALSLGQTGAGGLRDRSSCKHPRSQGGHRTGETPGGCREDPTKAWQAQHLGEAAHLVVPSLGRGLF